MPRLGVYFRCPKCGRELVEKKGIYGRFFACPGFPHCRFTIPVWQAIEGTTELKQICRRCDGKGKMPYVNKSGHTWSNMWLTCECAESSSEQDYYQPIYPEDFDFPCSEDFREYYARLSGEQPIRVSTPNPSPQVSERRESNISEKDFDRLQNLEGQVKYLQRKPLEREKKQDDYY